MARDDRAALRQLEARPLGLPAGPEVEWLGVSGYRLTHEGHTLFVDPYISRVPLRDLLLRRRALPDPAALERFVRAPGETGGVLVGHTTSTTRSTPRRSPGASTARRAARPRWST